MPKTLQTSYTKQHRTSKGSTASAKGCTIHELAFNNTMQANIISTVGTGKIVMVNRAASKLLGYSKKELLTKSRATIFDIHESSFKKMLKQRSAQGHSEAEVTIIKKSGKVLLCHITSSVFIDEEGIEKSITSIEDKSESVLKQKNIDSEKEKVVAENIILARSAQKKIDIKKEKIVADNIIIAKSRQKKIDIKKGKIVADNIALARSTQKKVDTKKAKTVANNIMLAQAKSDARLSQNNEWIKYIAKTSYDVMWDWDITTGQIYIGDSIEEVFGYKVENDVADFTDFKTCLLPGEKDIVEKKLFTALASTKKSWDDSFMFKRHDGSIAAVTSRASIVRDEEGKAIRLIGAIQDVSRLQELEKTVGEQITLHEKDMEKFLLAAKLSFDVIWDWNILTNEVFLGDGFEELFGYTIKNNTGHMITDWVNYLHPDDKQTVIKELQNCIRSSAVTWEHAYRVTRADGFIAKVYVRASIFRHGDGKAYRMIGAIQDLNRQKELEDKLEFEIKLKEKQITEAMEEAKNTERSDIGKELHDNVNQLLSASRMYLEMAKRGEQNSEMYLSRSSEYTLTAIEEIRKLTKGLTSDFIRDLGLCDSIDNLARDTMETGPLKISCKLDSFKEVGVNDKFKVNVYRIVQEQLNNILKHAKATKVNISLLQNTRSIMLVISDNGIGFDTEKKQMGIGLANIKSRAVAYNGMAEFVSQTDLGCVLTVRFPLTAV